MIDSKIQAKTTGFLGLLLWVIGTLLGLWQLSSGAILLILLSVLLATNKKITDLENKISFLQAERKDNN